ncbi:MAG: EamA family transporter [Aquificaceae bacterium]
MKGIIFAILTSFMWGISPILFKLGLKGQVNTVLALFIHNLSAGLLALGILALYVRSFDIPINQLFILASGGIVAGFLGLYFYFKSVSNAPISVVAPIVASSPLWSSLLAVLIFGESMSLKKLTGIIFVVSGIIILSLER